MSDRYWLLKPAVRGWLILFLVALFSGSIWAIPPHGQSSSNVHPQAPADHPVKEKPANSQANDQTSIESDRVSPAITPADPSKKEHDRGRTDDGRNQSGQDLIWGDTPAQWLMAITGIIAIVLSGWAVWLLRQTLIATNRTIDESTKGTAAAQEAAKAALEANEIVRQANIIDQRPWLRWEIIQPCIIKTNGPNLTLEVSARLTNFGKTTARKVIYFGYFYTNNMKENAINRGFRFYKEHIAEYMASQYSLADIIPNDSQPIRFTPSIKISDLKFDEDGKAMLFLSFHAAYKFFTTSQVAEIGAVYFLNRPGKLMDTFRMDDFGSPIEVTVLESPGSRLIT